MEKFDKEPVTIGYVGDPRNPDLEGAVIAAFSERENLQEMLSACFDIVYSRPFDERYLEQKIRVWNAMEEKQRGFVGMKAVRHQIRAPSGVFKVLRYPDSGAVQLEFKPIRKN